MLSKITLKNVALIKHLELDFISGLNIFSGETGAGKSILVDGLMLLLGAKYDKSILRHGEQEGFVEGVFESDETIGELLEAFGFEKDEMMIVVRKFLENGKNEIRINGRITTALTLAKITHKLVDIYGQNEYQSLAKPAVHLKILDEFLRGNLQDKTLKMRGLYMEILSLNRELKNIGSADQRRNQADMLRFSLEEIKRANLVEGEEEELIARRRIIVSGEKIAQALGESYVALSEGEATALNLIGTAKRSIGAISALSEAYGVLSERLDSLYIELDDVASGIQEALGGLHFDPSELEKIERRLDVIRTIKRKYGLLEELNKFIENAEKTLDDIENGTANLEKCLKAKQKKLDEAYALAKDIHTIRKSGAKKFETLMVRELGDLGMPGAVFTIEFSPFPNLDSFETQLSTTGVDSPEFYFSANIGQPPKPLIKIISGGELSRFMLALKVVASNTDDIPTMIFDEIDTGISGKIGQEVAKKLAVIASKHQVLCVTHLPQIAAMADNHFYIEKKVENASTVTHVALLDTAGEIEEVSRLSGAKDISKQASQNASEMKIWSREFKNSLKETT